MTGLIMAAGVIGAIGIVIGVLLGIASEKFKVEVDEREILVRAELPGNNCGGCGYPGCDGLANAIVAGNAAVNACPVGGSAVADKIAEIFTVEVEYEAGFETLLVFEVEFELECAVYHTNVYADGIYFANLIEDFYYRSYKVVNECVDTV